MKSTANQIADPMNDVAIVLGADSEIRLMEVNPHVTPSRMIASHHPRVKTPYPLITTSGVAARSRKSKI
jgi:hypothetical protein